MSFRAPLVILAASATFASSPAAAQVVHAPASIVEEDPVPVTVSGLAPGALVDVVAIRGGQKSLRSTARFRVSRGGTIDVARDAPISGDYAGRDAAGLFWSMHTGPSIQGDPQVGKGQIHIAAIQNGRTLATADVSVSQAEAGLTKTSVGDLPGAVLHRRDDKKRLPVAILLGGSEGGDSFGTSMVPFITRKGYAALVLPYYAPAWVTDPGLKGLPTDFVDIPVDRLERVRSWIASQPGLDPKRIVIIGVSKGGEFAMLAAAHCPWLRAVVGVVPSDVVWEGWGASVTQDDTRSSFSWKGKALPWVPYDGMRAWLAALQRGEPARLADVHARGRAAHPERVPAATIGVERFPGPMMVVGGGQDAIWPSSTMVSNIAARRRAAGLRTEVLLFPGAGHNLSGSGWEPLRASGDDATAAATAQGQLTFRKRLTRFLRNAR